MVLSENGVHHRGGRGDSTGAAEQPHRLLYDHVAAPAPLPVHLFIKSIELLPRQWKKLRPPLLLDDSSRTKAGPPPRPLTLGAMATTPGSTQPEVPLSLHAGEERPTLLPRDEARSPKPWPRSLQTQTCP